MLPSYLFQGVGGTGPVPFFHGVGGTGPVPFATATGLAFGLALTARFRRLMAATRTKSTRRTTVSHLFMINPQEAFRSPSRVQAGWSPTS